jgi:hypothetical protein
MCDAGSKSCQPNLSGKIEYEFLSYVYHRNFFHV